MLAKRLREVLYLVLGIAALAAIGWGIVWALNSTVYSPASAARDYLQLVADGRLDEAAEVVPPAVPDELAALATDAVLADPADRIGDIGVVGSEVDGPTARVELTYRLGGRQHSLTLAMQRVGSTLGVIGHWAPIEPPLAEVSVEVDGPAAVTLNGVEVPVADGVAQAAVYPGRYRIGLPASERYFASDGTTVVAVPAQQAGPVALAVTGTPALAEAADAAVRELLDTTCLPSRLLAPVGCPFGTSIDVEYRRVDWSIRSYPALEVAADGLSLVTSDRGVARVVFEKRDVLGRVWLPASAYVRFGVTGAVVVADGSVSVVIDQ